MDASLNKTEKPKYFLEPQWKNFTLFFSMYTSTYSCNSVSLTSWPPFFRAAGDTPEI